MKISILHKSFKESSNDIKVLVEAVNIDPTMTVEELVQKTLGYNTMTNQHWKYDDFLEIRIARELIDESWMKMQR